jgi:hypothetical protein
MSNRLPWKISVVSALRASFLQPNGPSRPGADWLVVLERGTEAKKLLVRIFADDAVGMSPVQVAQLAVGYVAKLIGSGWSPLDYKGKPGELTVPPRALGLSAVAKPITKPWWRFW